MNYNHLDNKELINYVNQNTTLEVVLAKRLDELNTEYEDFKQELEILIDSFIQENASDAVNEVIYNINHLLGTYET